MPNPPSPLELVRGFMPARVVLTAVELRLFDKLGDSALTAADLSARLSTDPRATARLLDALAGLGYLTKDAGGAYANTEASRRWLLSDGEASQIGGLRHYTYLWHGWSTLTDVLRTGGPVRRAEFGTPEDRTESFMAAMACFAIERAPLLADLLDLSEAEQMLDLGCGPGSFIIELCRRWPGLRGTAFDVSPVIPITRRNVETAGLTDRIDFLVGDFNTDDLPGGYDLVLLSSILHSNSEAENRALLKKTFGALQSGGQVVVMEFFTDDSKTQPPAAALFGINMLVNTAAGDVFSVNQVSEWLTEAGFVSPEVLPGYQGADWLRARKP